jgi:hypothetical protein
MFGRYAGRAGIRGGGVTANPAAWESAVLAFGPM